jgi:hypothetical protein
LKYTQALIQELLVSGEALEENEDKDAINYKEEDLDEITFNSSNAC